MGPHARHARNVRACRYANVDLRRSLLVASGALRISEHAAFDIVPNFARMEYACLVISDTSATGFTWYRPWMVAAFGAAVFGRIARLPATVVQARAFVCEIGRRLRPMLELPFALVPADDANCLSKSASHATPEAPLTMREWLGDELYAESVPR